jgi:phosphoglycolate phosphatase
MIKYVIWDWNGTLLDDVDFCVSSMNQLLAARSIPEVSIEKYGELFQFPVSIYYERLGFDFEKESFETVSNQFISLYLKGISSCPLREDARKVLTEINKLGIGNTILTASKQSLIDEQISIYKLESQFQSWHGIDNYHAAGKVEIGLELVESLPFQGSEMLFVGDTLHDAEVAEKMGVPCVLIHSGHQSVERLQAGNNTVVASLMDILSLVN